MNKKQLTHSQIFTNNERVHVLGYGQGNCIGYVDNARLIRVQFDSGNVRDFHPNKLRERLVPINS
jgi:hypothetical protein